jgi:peptide/nickel transport system substrate-binding protein
MKHKMLYTLLAVFVLTSMILAACAPAAPATTEAPAPVETEVPVATEAPVVTEAPATEEPMATEAPTEAMPAREFLWTQGLRQAIAAAIDREVIVDRVFEGRNTPAYHMVPSDYPFATEPFLDKYGVRDLELAKQLLTAEGYSAENPFVLELWYPPEHYGATTADVMSVVKEQLEETGMIKVELQSQNWAEYVDSFVAGDLPFFILGWFPDFVDPDNWLRPFAYSVSSPDNGIFYNNPDMDKLIDDASSASDPAERTQLYQEIGDLYAEDVPTIPLFWEPEFITYRNGIEGIKIGPPFEFNYNVLSFGPDATPASGNADTIIIGTTDEVNSLDPQDAYATHDWEILKNTNVALLGYTPGTGDLVPGVAAELPTVSEDGLTWTFKLRQDVTFADGTPVNAQTYVDSWARLNTLEGQVSGLVQGFVENIEAVDDYTINIKLLRPTGFFPALAATAPFIPANPANFAADQIVQFPEKLDGTGAYRMVSFVPGEQLVLEANPTYFGDDKAIIPNVIIRYFADPTTMSQAVEKGEIDIAWRKLGAVESTKLMEVEGLTVEKVNAPALRYLVLNHQFPFAP